MEFERYWALFKSNCYHTKLWLDEHPIFILLLAATVLIFSIFRMDKEKSSAGQWAVICVCVFLVLYALGQMTGLGFGMSF